MPEEDSVSDRILDTFSIVPSSSKIQMLAVPYEMCDESEIVNSAEKNVK